ncbi:MAG TPA: prolipoprotein diacylglyceryl transferase [Elusimicrobiales bacterium]|nr:prolipoprotein diacylglyceryl transferase [Elusimicrobiales bacterium]
MHPFILQIGSFKLPAYGLMVAAGYLSAILFIFSRAGRAGLKKETLSDLIFYTVLSGMLGAKLFYAALYWREFGPDTAARLLYLVKTFQYGFVFYGGIAGGAAGFVLTARRCSLSLPRTADLFAPALALGHAFGRIGCFLAGCCHGSPYSGPLSVTFTNPACEVDPALLGTPLHPVQLYEAAGNLFIFVILMKALDRALQRRLAPGTVIGAYALLYAALRGALEFLRGDDRGFSALGLSPGQLLSAAIAATAAVYLFKIKANHENK